MTEPTALTVLTAVPSRVGKKIPFMTKAIEFHGNEPHVIAGYDNGYLFNLNTFRIADIVDLFNTLSFLADRSHSAIIRGESATGEEKVTRILRRVHSRPDEPATLKDAPRIWVAIDIDRYGPTNTALDDPDGLLDELTEHLPSEFRSVSAVVQFTSSHGKDNFASVRLWFILSEPLNSAEMKSWLAPHGGPGRLVDLSLFNPAHIHYTAAPKVNGTDRFKRRLFYCERSDQAVPVRTSVLEKLKSPALPMDGLRNPQRSFQAGRPEGARLTIDAILTSVSDDPWAYFALWNELTDFGQRDYPNFEGYLAALRITDTFNALTLAAVGSAVRDVGPGIDRDWLGEQVSTALTEGWNRVRPGQQHELARRIRDLPMMIERICSYEAHSRAGEAQAAADPGEPTTTVDAAAARDELRQSLGGQF
jgi:hypothetical protein